MRTVYISRPEYEVKLMDIPPTDKEIRHDLISAEVDNFESDYLLAHGPEAICGSSQNVTAGGGAWDVAICRLPAIHPVGMHDYQVND